MSDPDRLRRPRRRYPLRIALCLLVGFIATLATAWGPAIARGSWPVTIPGGGYYRSPTGDGWWVGRTTGLWIEHWVCMRDGGGVPAPGAGSPIYTERIPTWVVTPPQTESDRDCNTTAAGLPFRCVRNYDSLGPTGVYSEHECWRVGYGRFDVWFLPVGVIWPGFAANVGLWSPVAAIAVFVWPALRRLRRVRRGLCAECGYPRGAAGPCPECGHHALTC